MKSRCSQKWTSRSQSDQGCSHFRSSHFGVKLINLGDKDKLIGISKVVTTEEEDAAKEENSNEAAISAEEVSDS